ncbi:MAG: SPOR domain-containing protein [Candidatus Omnitrophota bacterium]|nr:SPOR domain-containing protein [Candidatus Omnitrophota bacterium]
MTTHNVSLKIILFFIFLLSAFSFQLSASHAESAFAAASARSRQGEAGGGSGPENVEILFLGGSYEKAMDEAGRLIDAGARHKDELYYIKGLSGLKTARFREARQSFEKILSKYHRSARAFDAHVGIGDSYFLEGDADRALRSYKETMDKFSDDKNMSVLLYRIGSSYKKLGYGDRAKEYFDKAKSVPPLSLGAIKRFETFFDKGGEAGSNTISSSVESEVLKIEAVRFISVQAGSFKDKKNADRLARKLSLAGYDSYIETSTAFGEKLYRVRVGRFKSLEEAKPLESRLNQDGYRTKISGSAACD